VAFEPERVDAPERWVLIRGVYRSRRFPDNPPYYVWQEEDGSWRCTCPGFMWGMRKEPRLPCTHVRAEIARSTRG
jgi:hypothetical protein